MEGLLVKNKFCFIDGTCPRQSMLHAQHTRQDRYNVIVKEWIRNALTKELASSLVYNSTAQVGLLLFLTLPIICHVICSYCIAQRIGQHKQELCLGLHEPENENTLA